MPRHDGRFHLKLLSTSTLTTPVTGGHLACNPVIDLTATVGEGNVLSIWRPNQQLVSKHTERNQKIAAIRWKDDGQFLAAGWSDGVVRLVGLESSKAVHHIRVGNGAASKIEYIAWSRNQTRRRSAEPSSTSQLPSRNILLDEEKDLLDLPHELEFLDVETALPKLSPLPVSGGSGDDMFVFSTTSSLDFVFRPCKPEDADTVHIMLVGTADGGIHLSIYDSFVVGTFNPSPLAAPKSVMVPGNFELCGHGSHPDISTHSLLLRPRDGDGSCLYLVPMDLRFIHDSSVNLSLLASKTTSLQNLLRYLKQAQSHMASEFKSTRELPGRFLLGVREDLQKMERGSVTVVQALCHTVATGDVFPPLREWLVDSLAERGHKRWDKAVVSGLQNLRALVHENFIPALERCGVILSRLLGIARFHDARESIGFTAVQIRGILDLVSCLTTVSHNILANVMDELEYFAAFSTWLRLEIDQLASSTASEDLTEKEVTIDHAKVMVYIQRYLVKSPLAVYFDEIAKDDYAKDLELAETGSSLVDLLDKQLKKCEAGTPYMKALPNVGFLVEYLGKRADRVFRDIAEAEKRGVRFGQATEIAVGGKIWKHDVHVCSGKTSEERKAVTFTAVVSESDKSKVFIYQTVAVIVNGISSRPFKTVCGLNLPAEGTIIDLKFLDDESLLVLCRLKGNPEPILLRAEYQLSLLRYSVQGIGAADMSSNPMVIFNEGQVWTSLRFSDEVSGLAPIQMDVQSRSSARGEMPDRVCLLGRDKVTYRTYVLPEDWEAVRKITEPERAAMVASQ